ncbi:MAG: VWA domain-containing protein, partial [Alloprevotella sp.]|nr:VWA domain-containing protein [Alloprevotella sp.]
VVILITDGMNNTGEISPIMAADMARESKIRVYTIAIGQNSGNTQTAVAILPNGEEYMADVENTTDPTTLQEIARQTGGIFYQAETKNRLSEIYKDIDRLEKTKLEQINYDKHYEAYQLFALLALISLALEMLLRLTLLNRLP